MSEPGVQCPLCKRVVKIVVHTAVFSPSPKIEDHTWQGDLIDRLNLAQYAVRCPMSGQQARRT